MAKDSDKADGFTPARSPYGPRPLGALIPALTKPVFRKKRSPAGAQLMADWAGVVGPALSRVTSPLRFTAGTLTIGCAGPVAMELTHLAPQLIGRINAHLGKPMVDRLRFVQQARPAPRRSPTGPRCPAAQPRSRRRSPPSRGEKLRAALAKLGRGVYRNCSYRPQRAESTPDPERRPHAPAPPNPARRDRARRGRLRRPRPSGPSARPIRACRSAASATPSAPVKVIEFFSLTCSHCAAFHKEVFPRVKTGAGRTGAIRLIWSRFPARPDRPDRRRRGSQPAAGALRAASSARCSPARTAGPSPAATRWSSSARWRRWPAWPKTQYDQVIGDDALKRAILEQRMVAEKEFSVQATPSFSFQAAAPSATNPATCPLTASSNWSRR